MPTTALLDLYIVASISQVALMLFAVYYAVHIMRRIGTFWAWTMMVLAFGLLAVRDFTSVASVLATPVAQLVAKTEVFTITSYWPGTIINEASYSTLAVATFGLDTIFGGKAVDATAPPEAVRPKGVEAISLRRDRSPSEHDTP